MKKIYVCSPYRGDVEENVRRARKYCRLVTRSGHIPYAPHLLFTQFLDDEVPEQREVGLKMGLEMLGVCDEIWVYGHISEGMRREIEKAKELGKPIIDGSMEYFRGGEKP